VAAGGAAGEVVVRTASPGLKQVRHLVLGHRSHLPVAGRAPGPGHQWRGEPLEDVGELFVGAAAADVCPEPQRPATEQTSVLGEQHTALGVGLRDQRVVVEVIGVGGIHTEQPQPPGQRAEMDVEDETRRPRRKPLRSLDRTHLYHVTVARPVRRGDLPAVDE
jgi:hypothetical protein